MADAAEIYSRMTDNERWAIVAHVIEQGRHLDNLDEWTMEDNFGTTEALVTAYRAVIHPHEDPITRCDCGNDRHHDDGLSHCTECDDTYTIGTGGDGKCADCLEPEPEYTAQVIDPNGVRSTPQYTPLTREGAREFLLGRAQYAAANHEARLWIGRDLDQNDEAEWNGYRFSIVEIERD